ncbi:MAG TPA: ACT domain-containing protein [Egibacteraceae bacterium]|nr:ACT domain-containing protein [Egibacteraceae bacterium]
MEVMLRCAVHDRPGALAELAGAIAGFGGDIQGVDVVESADGQALDDLLVVIDAPQLSALLNNLEASDDVEVVHVGPSRGHPGDGVARLAVGFEALLTGAMAPDHGVAALLSGLLRASSADLVPAQDAPRAGERVLILAVDHRVLVLRRDYRFTRAERDRAAAVLAAGLAAAKAASSAT